MYKIDDKKILYIVVLIILVGIILPLTFSIYKSDVDVKAVTTTGRLICNFDIDTKDDYIDEFGKYFYLNVYNYEEKDQIYITDTNIEYKLTITDKNKNNILFNYKDQKEKQLQIQGIFNNTNKDNIKYKIYINNNDIKKVKVNLNVKLEAYQKI